MDDYMQMYLVLFNRITDIIIELHELQKESEELFLSVESEQRLNLLN